MFRTFLFHLFHSALFYFRSNQFIPLPVNVDNLENFNHHRGRAVLIEDDKVYVVGDKGIKRQIVK